MKFKVLPTGVGYAGRQARRRSAIIKYFFHCMFRKDWVKKGCCTVTTRREMCGKPWSGEVLNRKSAHCTFPLLGGGEGIGFDEFGGQK